MPELPEVETIKNGLNPHIKNTTIKKVTVRQPKLRWPIPDNLNQTLKNTNIKDIKRRSKYLLFEIEHNNNPAGLLVIHLGMSGNLRIVDKTIELKKHDHVDIELNNNKVLRYNDPRRFGAIMWVDNQNYTHDNTDNKYSSLELIQNHERFKHLGPEPLTDDFNKDYIYNKAKNRNTPIKNFIMNNQIVVGVGNIYATEALFYSKIHPQKPAGDLTSSQWNKLVAEIKKILTKAIKSGGTTLKDFTNSDGKPGYFKQELAVYGRSGEPCVKCKQPLKSIRQQGRTTIFCDKCQK